MLLIHAGFSSIDAPETLALIISANAPQPKTCQMLLDILHFAVPQLRSMVHENSYPSESQCETTSCLGMLCMLTVKTTSANRSSVKSKGNQQIRMSKAPQLPSRQTQPALPAMPCAAFQDTVTLLLCEDASDSLPCKHRHP